jgi:hypothetical protein
MTDIKTGWTIHFALMNKASAWGVQALDKAVESLLNCTHDVPVIPCCGTERYG